ncbi:hypothetical protein L204_101060 [Cryptococcus depauperatus]|nr:hypothetical protein L204_01012 [Cryptococcus depauperatus CBS 7855]
MTSPIPISSSSGHNDYRPALKLSPPSSTSLSLSPQTPFFPPPGLATSTTPTQPNSLFKWAAASLGKSPVMSQAMDFKPGVELIDDHEHEHDSFEFGDFGDTNARSWVKGRRALSMSMPLNAQSGISAMLQGSGQYSPNELKHNGLVRDNQAMMADKAAKGQGVLRRLSMGGYKAPFLSPTTPCLNLPPSPPSDLGARVPPPISCVDQGQPEIKRDATLQPNAHSRGRRYSEGVGMKRRGVSPMGERLLREQGHF